jgi:hypothetical protein
MISKKTIFLLVFCTSCGLLPKPLVNFILKNETEYELRIEVFEKSKIIENLSIKSKATYEKSIEIGGLYPTSPFNQDADSIVIKFDNKRFLKQYCKGKKLYGSIPICSEIKPLYDFNFGTFISNGHKTDSWVLVVDEGDYSRAIPL